MELVPIFTGDYQETMKGFMLVVHRHEKYYLQYAVSKAIENEHSGKEIISSVAFQNIAAANNLKDAVFHMMKYLRDEFKVTEDDILELLKRVELSQSILVDPIDFRELILRSYFQVLVNISQK